MNTPGSLALLVFALLLPFGPGPGAVRAAEFDRRLANLSTRAQVGAGADVMIAGFVVAAGAPKKILLRAVRPATGPRRSSSAPPTSSRPSRPGASACKSPP